MSTKLEQLAVIQRTTLINPNYYNLNWKPPLNNNNVYSATHTRALSDNTTPIYGKGTGKFLDTNNGGGSLDINGNPINGGLGRLSSIQLNTAQWSYGPATPYSVTNTRALSDNTTPIYGKGTGKYLDTSNGGGSLDINGNPINGGVGRLGAFQLNTAQWSYGPATPYSVTNTRALSDNTTPVYGKGTGVFLDQNNGGGSLDINGNPVNGGKGRIASLLLNIFNKGLPYEEKHTRALSDTTTPDNGKGNLNSKLLSSTNDFVLEAHFDIKGGSKTDRKGGGKYPSETGRENLLSVKNNYFFPDLTTIVDFKTNKTDWYTIAHSRALAGNDENGKATDDSTSLSFTNNYVLDAHYNIKGGGLTDRGENPLKSTSGRKNLLSPNTNIYFPDLTTIINFKSDTTADVYNKTHKNALSGLDSKGKGDSSNNTIYLGDTENYKTIGSIDDVNSRNNNNSGLLKNTYKPNTTKNNAQDDTNYYNLKNNNTLADGDDKGKATNDKTSLSSANNYILDAHYNIKGGSKTDIKGGGIAPNESGRENLLSVKTNIYFPDLTTITNFKNDTTPNLYGKTHKNALSGTDSKGKGDSSNNTLYLGDTENYKTIGSIDDINSRNNNNSGLLSNLYKPNPSQPNDKTKIYSLKNPNALASNDERGKSTDDGNYLSSLFQYTLVAHININGGNLTDRGDNTSKPDSGRKNLLSQKNNKYQPDLTGVSNFIDESKGNWYKKPDTSKQSGSFAIK